jgi:hypothetical protein
VSPDHQRLDQFRGGGHRHVGGGQRLLRLARRESDQRQHDQRRHILGVERDREPDFGGGFVVPA